MTPSKQAGQARVTPSPQPQSQNLNFLISQRKVCNEKAEAIKSLAEIGGLDSRALEEKCKNGSNKNGSGLSDPSKILNNLFARKL